jgi:hypothetical protein
VLLHRSPVKTPVCYRLHRSPLKSAYAGGHGKHCSYEREKVIGREKERGRGIKYGIVGIEYGIEIIWVREK